MTDTLSPEKRSALMARIKGKDTRPEILIRHLLFSLGYRYRLHRTDLPGTPDIVFPARKKVIFVHGCFWHGHNCRRGNPPKSNREYWLPKLKENSERDTKARKLLAKLGWKAITIWECQLANPEKVAKRLIKFLDN